MRTYTDLTEIKLILLFVLKNIGKPLSINELTEIVMHCCEINYFSLAQYLSELVEGNYVTQSAGELPFYEMTEKGEKVLSYFLFHIAAATKEKLLAEINHRYQTSLSSAVEADYLPDGDRYTAQLRVVEQGTPLFELRLPGLWRSAAKRACDRFRTHYEGIYARLVELLFADKRSIKAVVFDLDGTLLNTLEDLAASMNTALTEAGFAGHPAEDYRYFVGDGVYTLAERVLPEGERTDERIRALADGHARAYATRWKGQTTPYEGVPALLECLTHFGVKLCVLTNKPSEFAQKMIAHFFPETPFACVMGQCADRPKKPAPNGVLEMMELLSCKPEEMLYVGDSDVDMETAKNAGVFAAGALWGFRTAEELSAAGAGYLAQRPLDLLRLFDFTELC